MVNGHRASTTLDRLLPGWQRWREEGRIEGAICLSFWLGGWILFLASLDRITGFFEQRQVQMDQWVAMGTLLLMIAGSWIWNVRSRRTVRSAGRGISQWELAGRRFRRNRLAVSGLWLMIALYVVTLLTPLIAPYDPIVQGDIVATRFLPPSADHWLGTDRFGRDVLTRILYGARISLSIGFIAVGIGLLLGTLVGATAGYYGRWIDRILMRVTDTMLAFPRLVLLILVIALFEPSIFLVIAVLGVTGWMGIARIVRGEVLALKEREYIQAARALGMRDLRIITRHILPGILAPIIVYATLGIGNTILLEAGLSFLGLGVQPPTPSWGNMISQGRDTLTSAWWIATFPGLAIVFTVMAFNFLGDGLRDALDPKQ